MPVAIGPGRDRELLGRGGWLGSEGGGAGRATCSVHRGQVESLPSTVHRRLPGRLFSSMTLTLLCPGTSPAPTQLGASPCSSLVSAHIHTPAPTSGLCFVPALPDSSRPPLPSQTPTGHRAPCQWLKDPPQAAPGIRTPTLPPQIRLSERERRGRARSLSLLGSCVTVSSHVFAQATRAGCSGPCHPPLFSIRSVAPRDGRLGGGLIPAAAPQGSCRW